MPSDREMFFILMARVLKDREDHEGAARMERCAERAREQDRPMAAG
jgi:hypothetical protein